MDPIASSNPAACTLALSVAVADPLALGPWHPRPIHRRRNQFRALHRHRAGHLGEFQVVAEHHRKGTVPGRQPRG